MTRTNMYGEPWEPPPPIIVNSVHALIEESGISDYFDTDVEGMLDWMAERIPNAPQPDHFDVMGRHRKFGTPKVFRIGFELQDERESSYYITYIRPNP